MGSCRCAARAGDRRTVPLAQGGLAWRSRALRRGTIVANAIWLACIANHTVIPAKAGTYAAWVPAFAGMTILCGVRHIMPLRPSWRLDGELATGLPIGVCGGTRFSVRRATKQAGNANARKCPQINANGTGGAAPTLPAGIGRAGRLASAGCCPTHLPAFAVHPRHRFLAVSRQPTAPPGGRAGARPTVHDAASRRRDGAAAVAAGARGAICLHCR